MTLAIGTEAATAPLHTLSITRREPTPADVEIDILYCGICHSDLHMARNEWGESRYPLVPGHEIIGRVTRVGAEVSRFAPGDIVGVGVMVDSCQQCDLCHRDLEQYCQNGRILTYNDPDRHLGGYTFGGYSQRIVVDQHFVLRIPQGMDLAGAAPLLCAGITTYSPLRHWQAGPGKRVGVVGLGGLGHMAIKLAAAMGAEVVVITTTPAKAEDARRLGAHHVVVSSDATQMAGIDSSLDLIIDCVSAPHDINLYLDLLTLDGALVLVGLPEVPLPVKAFSLVGLRRSLAGSSIGGIAETQEMLDFCAQHNIVSDVEVMNADQVNEAYERLLKGDVRYRFVINMKSLG